MISEKVIEALEREQTPEKLLSMLVNVAKRPLQQGGKTIFL